jgi:hypothetical protein
MIGPQTRATHGIRTSKLRKDQELRVQVNSLVERGANQKGMMLESVKFPIYSQFVKWVQSEWKQNVLEILQEQDR